LARGHCDFDFDRMPVRVREMSPAKRRNLALAGTLLLRRPLHPHNWPLHMQFELTSYCNLHCPVCPIGTGELRRPPQAMDVGLFERVWAEVGPYLLTTSLWAWGEPLLHPQLLDILRIAQTQPVATLLSTNGQALVRDSVIEALAGYPPTYLIVCIDGLTDETNSRYRAGARLAPALAGVRRLADIKRSRGMELPILHMRYIVMKHNEHELPYIESFAREHGFDLVTLRTLLIIDSAAARHGDLLPGSDEFRAYRYQDGKRLRRDDYICQQPFWYPTVFADGTFVACDQDYNAQLPFGVLSKGVSLRDLWFGARATAVRRAIRDHRSSLSFCQNCPFADCPAEGCSVRAIHLRGGIAPVVGPGRVNAT
jgi:radical SAM protein with 4Fe4S-binding SPASM domain